MCHRPEVFIKEVLNKPKHFAARKIWTYHTRISLSFSLSQHFCSLPPSLSPASQSLAKAESCGEIRLFPPNWFIFFPLRFFYLFLFIFALFAVSAIPPAALSFILSRPDNFALRGSDEQQPQHMTVPGVPYTS